MLETFAAAGDRLFLALGQAVPSWAIMSAVAGSYLGLAVAVLFAVGAPMAKARIAVRASRHRF